MLTNKKFPDMILGVIIVNKFVTIQQTSVNKTMEVIMDTKGRKLWMRAAGMFLAGIIAVGTCETTAMASSIGVIDTADMLDIHSESDSSSDVVGQIMDEAHVAILENAGDWVKIQAGDITGWVSSSNIHVKEECDVEEAVSVNEQIIEEIQQDAESTQDNSTEDGEETEESVEQETEETENSQPEQVETSENVQNQTEESEEVKAEEEAKAEEAARQAAEEAAKAEAEEAARQAAQEAAKAEAEEAARLAAEEAAKAAEEAARQAAEEAAKAAEEAARQAAEEAAKAAEEAARQAAEEAAKAAEEAARQAAEEAAKAAVAQQMNVSQSDMDLLAAIIYCEAGSEPYVGKVAVGNVVMNRVKHPSYPNSISEVIYARGQFSPVRNGSLEKALKYNRADQSCYQAAWEALSGSAPVGDKLYFRRNNGRSGQVIGHHVFY